MPLFKFICKVGFLNIASILANEVLQKLMIKDNYFLNIVNWPSHITPFMINGKTDLSSGKVGVKAMQEREGN